MIPIALITAILPALIPPVADGLRGLFARFTGGAGMRPQNVDEAIKLMSAETERMRALAELDRPAGDISRWVADLRASFRYLACGMTITMGYGFTWLAGSGYLEVPVDVQNEVLYMANAAFSFLFGDRSYAYMKRGK